MILILPMQQFRSTNPLLTLFFYNISPFKYFFLKNFTIIKTHYIITKNTLLRHLIQYYETHYYKTHTILFVIITKLHYYETHSYVKFIIMKPSINYEARYCKTKIHFSITEPAITQKFNFLLRNTNKSFFSITEHTNVTQNFILQLRNTILYLCFFIVIRKDTIVKQNLIFFLITKHTIVKQQFVFILRNTLLQK